MSKILVVAAHPDDEILGVGGTMAALSEQGHEVFVLIVTEGCSSQYQGQDVQRLIADKKACALQAGKLVGVRQVLFGDLPDMRLDTLPHVEINRVIERAIRQVGPEVVFTHHFGDVNRDHQRVYESTLVAVRPVQGACVRKVYTYETLSSTEWQETDPRFAFVPNTYHDISSQLDRKIEALLTYEQEVREYPHPRSAQAIRNLAMLRGQSVGMLAAEAFCLVRDCRREYASL